MKHYDLVRWCSYTMANQRQGFSRYLFNQTCYPNTKYENANANGLDTVEEYTQWILVCIILLRLAI